MLAKQATAAVISVFVSTAILSVRPLKAGEGTISSPQKRHSPDHEAHTTDETSADMNGLIEKACRDSESVVLAEYLGYHKLGEIVDFSHPPAADFLVLKILKGPSIKPHIVVLYELPAQPD